MQNETLKKAAAAAIASGIIAGGAVGTAMKEKCDYTVPVGKQEVCLTNEEVAAVKQSLETPSWQSVQTWGE